RRSGLRPCRCGCATHLYWPLTASAVISRTSSPWEPRLRWWRTTTLPATARAMTMLWSWLPVPVDRRGAAKAMEPQPEIADPEYREALAAYLAGGGEALLARAYELGRAALTAGRSIPEVVGMHQRSLNALLAGTRRERVARRV